MVATLSPRVEELLAADLAPEECLALVEGLRGVTPRGPGATPGERHAEQVERVVSVRRGDAETLSVDEVERSLRNELHF